MLYRINWAGTLNRMSGDRLVNRVHVEGWLLVRAANDESARSYARDDSERLLDVDFMFPGQRFSASNRDVLDGDIITPCSLDEEGIEFHAATITRIDRIELIGPGRFIGVDLA